MAASRLFSQLRRRPRSLSSLSPPASNPFHHRTPPPHPSPPPPPIPFRRPTLQSSRIPFSSACSFLHQSRSFYIGSSSSSQDSDQLELSRVDESVAGSELLDLGIVPRVSEVVGGDEYVLPVRFVISVLDGFRDLTGLPWWIVIASSTLALRMVLFPLLVLQLNKLKRISELFPKLPPALPQTVSGRSYMDHISLFRKEQQAVGCPSFLWFFAYLSVQGSLVYWTTNATLTVIQQLSLNNPVVLKKLGLSDNRDSTEAANPKERLSDGTISWDPLGSRGKLAVQNLSAQEFLALAVKLLAEGQKDNAIHFLKLALEKDPEYVRALIVMGQTLLQKGLLADANEYLERAITKLNLVDHPMEVEEVDLLILATQWAGVASIRQGKNADGIMHLQRVANLQEPEDSTSKAHYFDGLLLLSSALYDEGRKSEAAKYLRMLVSYNPAYSEFLEHCENDSDNFVGDLVSSRRGDF